MANITVYSNGHEIEFKSKALEKATLAIIKLTESNNRNGLTVAAHLGTIAANKLYEEDFSKFENYAATVFGLKKAQAYNMAKIGLEWVAFDEKGKPTGESAVKHTGRDWNTTQLLVLSRNVSKEEANEMVEAGTISPYMTVKDLEAIFCDNDEEPEEAPEETEVDEEAETEESEGKEDIINTILENLQIAKDTFCKSDFTSLAKQIEKIIRG